MISRSYRSRARRASAAISGEIRVESILGHRELLAAQRGETAEPAEEVPLHQDVIGDGDDVETSGLAVQVDHLPHRQPSVAPGRVHVKVAQQE
jgi:hypothetical protein